MKIYHGVYGFLLVFFVLFVSIFSLLNAWGEWCDFYVVKGKISQWESW